jgi:hypothetical protein
MTGLTDTTTLTKSPSSKSAIAVYGCHNKPREPKTYLAQDGYTEPVDLGWGNLHRAARWIEVKPVMSLPCAYDHAATDPRCAACKNMPTK